MSCPPNNPADWIRVALELADRGEQPTAEALDLATRQAIDQILQQIYEACR